MNSDPENQADLVDETDLDSSELRQIENLLELLVEEEAVVENAVQANDGAETDATLAEIAALSQVDSPPDFSFIEEPLELETDSSPDSEPISTIEEVEALSTQTVSPEELADALNSLIPLIVGLLQFKLEHSQTGVIQTVRPVLDRLIEERTQEDSPKMAAAIARILPAAIKDEIKQNPLAIAKAIAPELALSIREQILLDENAIPQALGPEMGKAIKAQIESEKDAMVDALYPVIGSTISKYMVEVVQDINSKVEQTLSFEGIKRKIRARMQGVSEAELIFKESVGYRVRAIFLIDKDSGLVIQEIQIPGEQHLDSDMLAGMLTAIRSFANDCIAAGSELDLIDYGDWQIPLEVAGYCYLAVIVAGEPPKEFITKIRRVLGDIVIEHDETIQNFDGDLAQVPLAIRQKLEQLTEANKDLKAKSSSSPPLLLWLLIFFLSLIFVPWGLASYRKRIANRIENQTAVQLDGTPELSVYRLDPVVKDGKLVVSGRVPSEDLRDRADLVVQQIAAENKLEVDNQIIAVDVPANPSLVRGEINRLTSLFNQQQDVNIKTRYQSPTLAVEGFILDKSVRETISAAFTRIPGVQQTVFDLEEQLPVVEQRIYFNSGSTTLDFADNFSKINAVEQLLQQNPQLHLKLIAHTDNIGTTVLNRQLAQKRCQSVKAALIAREIEANRLIADCNLLLTAKNEDNDRVAWLRRYVSFKPFIPPNSQ